VAFFISSQGLSSKNLKVREGERLVLVKHDTPDFFFCGACHFEKYFLNGAPLGIFFEFSKTLKGGEGGAN
jgi:hypothetical protein